MLQAIFKEGRCVYESPHIVEIRNKTLDELNLLHPSIKRFLNPHKYVVGLDEALHSKRLNLIERSRNA